MIDNLYELLKAIKAPKDLEDYHSFLSPLRLNTLTKQSESFQKLVNQFMEVTQGNRRSDHRQKAQGALGTNTVKPVLCCLPT